MLQAILHSSAPGGGRDLRRHSFRGTGTSGGVTESQLKGAPKFNRTTDWDWSDRNRDKAVYDYYHTPFGISRVRKAGRLLRRPF
jgi:hypothetical protein